MYSMSDSGVYQWPLLVAGRILVLHIKRIHPFTPKTVKLESAAKGAVLSSCSKQCGQLSHPHIRHYGRDPRV